MSFLNNKISRLSYLRWSDQQKDMPDFGHVFLLAALIFL